jgi:hypothetical protein
MAAAAILRAFHKNVPVLTAVTTRISPKEEKKISANLGKPQQICGFCW